MAQRQAAQAAQRQRLLIELLVFKRSFTTLARLWDKLEKVDKQVFFLVFFSSLLLVVARCGS